jgi:glycerophosphoryl diester phosphodiesterase
LSELDPDDVAPSWPHRRAGTRVAVLAHRGGAGPWRENTTDAFAGAIALGADGVELDARASADGVAVVHHDALVEGTGPIAASAAAALPPWVPTLAEALAVCAGHVVNVELKLDASDVSPGSCAALAEAVATVVRGAPATPVVVSSFWPDAVEALTGLDAGIPSALLVHPALDPADAIPRARALGCVALHPHVSRLSAELVDRAHAEGLAVTTWTANEPGDLARALASGVDGVITDDVARTLVACGGR